MTIPCQTAETKTKANRICVIVWNLIVNFNICWEMKSLCCWIVDAGQVLCSMHADVSELLTIMTVLSAKILTILSYSDWTDGTDGDKICLPSTLMQLQASSPRNLCQFVLMLFKSTVALFPSEYIWSSIVSLSQSTVNRISDSAINSYLLSRPPPHNRTAAAS